MTSFGTWLAVVVVAMAGLGACVVEDEQPPADPGTATILVDPVEQIAISPKPSLMDYAAAETSGGIPDDPCDCSSPECLHDWLVDNVGCDVCLTFVCGGEDIAHVCASCPEAAGQPPGSESPFIQ